MQENNFEKQVQQKTDELKLTPSEGVWQKVAVAIAKRKDDRRIFAIIFLLLLCIGSAIFIIWDQSSGSKNNKAISEINNLGKTNTGNKQKSIFSSIPAKIVESAVVNEPGDNKKNPVGLKGAKTGIFNNTNKVKYNTRQKLSVLISKSSPVDLDSESIGSKNQDKTKVGETIPAINEVAGQVKDFHNKVGIDRSAHVKDTLSVGRKTGYPEEISVKRSIQSKQNSRWNFGFNFSAGVATTKNGYLGLIGSGSRDESGYYAGLTPAAGGNTGQGSYISHVPSTIKPGKGLVLGVFIQKNISTGISFLLGLNYKSYSSAMMIGNRVDSSSAFSPVNYFYRSGNTGRYGNHFHFLELPVAVRYKLGKQNKLPVYLSAGVSVSQLIYSNALQFDPLSGSYYNNNALFNKTQVNVSAALLFSLSGQAKNPFLIGPEINFSLTKMADTGLYKDHHYSYFGILVQKSIGRK